MNDIEVWRQIPGWEGYYSVSNLGPGVDGGVRNISVGGVFEPESVGVAILLLSL